MVEIWSDGSSSGKSNLPYGWAYIILQDNDVICAEYGGGPSGTNNIAEMEGAIRGIRAWGKMALRHKRSGETVVLVSDSQITLGLATGQYAPSKNVEAAAELRELFSKHCTGIKWVRGHTGVPANERVDSLAKKGRDEFRALSSPHVPDRGEA